MKLIKKWCLQLDNAMKFKTDEINKIKDYFTTEIREEETTSKTYSTYIAALNYFDKVLLVMVAASDDALFATVICAPVRITR